MKYVIVNKLTKSRGSVFRLVSKIAGLMLFLVRVRKEVNVKLRLEQQYLFLFITWQHGSKFCGGFGSGLNTSPPPQKKKNQIEPEFCVCLHMCRQVHVLTHDVICSEHPADGIQFELTIGIADKNGRLLRVIPEI